MANPTIYINPVSGSIKILGAVDFVDAEGNILETKEKCEILWLLIEQRQTVV